MHKSMRLATSIKIQKQGKIFHENGKKRLLEGEGKNPTNNGQVIPKEKKTMKWIEKKESAGKDEVGDGSTRWMDTLRKKCR